MNEVKIIINKDKDLFFDKPTFLRNVISRVIIIPFFKIIPKKIGTYFLRKSSHSANEVYIFSKSSHALEVIYNFDRIFKKTDGLLDGIFTYFWQDFLKNTRAVRNRFKIVSDELNKAIIEVSEKKKSAVNIFSLASGSARVVIDTVSGLKKKNNLFFQVKLLDLDIKALELSSQIAKKFNVSDDVVEYCNDKVSNFFKYCKDWKPDVIEMVGFLDYVPQDKAIKLTKNIYNELGDGGYFITGNIIDNSERIILSKILDWDMIYRNVDDLIEILIMGGFNPNKCVIILEPYKIHAIVVAKK